MKFNDVLRTALKETNATQSDLAEMAGTTQSAIGNALARKDIYITTFIRLLDKLGYEVIVRRKDGDSEMRLK